MSRLRTSEDVCIEYAIAMEVARSNRLILRNIKCEYAENPEKADYESGYPGSEGVPPCTHPWSENHEEGMCETCEKKRMPALLNLREARKRIARARRAIDRVGRRLEGIKS